jgi:hypothetical protein
MSKYSTSEVFIIASAAFLGGLLISALTNPKTGAQNRKWLAESTGELQQKMKQTGEEMKNKNFPDLYKATEDLGLTDEDLL